MNASRRARSATLVEILVFYDEPQLVLLQSSRNFKMLAVAIKHAEMKRPFFGCEISDKYLQKYFDNKADLNYAFDHAIGKAFYFFDLDDGEGDQVSLVRVTADEANTMAYWPKPGFFARSHTSSYNLRTLENSTVQVFPIDGSWSANDFSHLHGKMADLYAFFGAFNRLDDATVEGQEFDYLRRSIRERFWRGGGSYVGFYDDLLGHVTSIAPLEVERIQYASPGQVAFRGDQHALGDILEIVRVFDGEFDALSERYKLLYGILKGEHLLSARRDAEFSSAALTTFVQAKTFELAEAMALERVDRLFAACDNNPLVFCKVALSIYRRANELHVFRAEGRLQIEDQADAHDIQ
jgi:hypothetical protein